MTTTEDKLSRSLRALGLIDLLARIVHRGDKAALNELHERRLFRANGQRQRFVEFVQSLADRNDLESLWRQNSTILEMARDVLNDKFCSLPAVSDLKHKSVDCRLYLGACLRFLETDALMLTAKDKLVRELRSAEVLQNLVKRHFILSVLEARRRIRVGVRRFCWRIHGRALYLWLPREMTADACRQWLSERIGDFSLESSDLRERVQERISAELWLPRIMSASKEEIFASIESPLPPERWSFEREVSVRGLAEFVAQEKADNLALQRPAIQALGPQRLKKMILCIFEELAGGSYMERDIAVSFELSPASFSRFAGGQWARTAGGSMKVPDLWRNTAQTLSRHRVFVESAKDAGVWPSVQAVLAQRTRGGSDRDT